MRSSAFFTVLLLLSIEGSMAKGVSAEPNDKSSEMNDDLNYSPLSQIPETNMDYIKYTLLHKDLLSISNFAYSLVNPGAFSLLHEKVVDKAGKKEILIVWCTVEPIQNHFVYHGVQALANSGDIKFIKTVSSLNENDVKDFLKIKELKYFTENHPKNHEVRVDIMKGLYLDEHINTAWEEAIKAEDGVRNQALVHRIHEAIERDLPNVEVTQEQKKFIEDSVDKIADFSVLSENQRLEILKKIADSLKQSFDAESNDK